MRQVACQRAAIADRVVRNVRVGLGDQWRDFAHHRRLGDLVMPNQSAYNKHVVFDI